MPGWAPSLPVYIGHVNTPWGLPSWWPCPALLLPLLLPPSLGDGVSRVRKQWD